MKRCLIALIAVALSLTTGVGLATAAVPSTGIQTADQSATSGQAAGAAAGAAQTNPSNTNISIRVLSPGSDGSVDQSNTVDSDASASNKNSADQDATQSQSAGSTGACCGSGSTGIQSSSQSAANKQAAAALSLATQKDASNTNVPIRVLSPGSDGSVSQSNTVDSDASASNKNSADQDATQTQSGGSGTDCKCQDGSTGIQTSDQDAKNKQTAVAASEAKQIDPKNTNVSIRVLSPGKGGDVTQTNSVSSDATARNSNDADQTATQTQSAGSGPSSSSSDCKCHDGSTGVQTSDQSAKNEQGAIALSGAEQKGASNTNASIRVLSPGKDGDVWQTNSVDSDAKASNRNSADQDATQTQSGSGSGTGVQVSDQDAKSEQAALAASIAKQDHPSNTNTPIRVLSPGKGGDVHQTNSVESDATAKNSNDVDQTADQTQRGGSSDCKCHGGSTGIQTSDQSSKNAQLAIGLSAAEQKGAKNSNSPIRVGSYGNDGDVWQTNSVDSDASARNKNDVDQEATQTQGAGSGSATGIQVSDQSSKNEQAALAASIAKQDHAKNDNSPIRVLSPGKGGKVVQTNSVDSDASAKNSNDVDQTADQTQRGGSSNCKCHDGATGIQTSDQSAKSEQLALGFSAAEQKGAKNSNDPLRVKSYGSDGDVWQTNSVDSDAKASNKNDVDQDATQTQSAGSGSGLGIQVAGQEAKNHQGAVALSAALQDGASNENKPLRVLSPGRDGNVYQSNSVDSDASASNRNKVDQDVTQTQRGGSSMCGCHDGIGIQVAGQSSWNGQGSLAASFAEQKAGRSPCGCPSGASNVNDPARILSPGKSGSVWQSNSVDSNAKGRNSNHADQSADQSQAGAGAQLGIQVAGQEAKNEQLALVLAAALQHAPKNASGPLSVLSPGRGGSTSQSNDAAAKGYGANRNRSGQGATQRQM
jgi:hypothetical protein